MPRSKAPSASCPVCGKPQDKDFRPFCGRGCRDRDLLSWLGEGYRMPGRPASEEGESDGENGLDKAPWPRL